MAEVDDFLGSVSPALRETEIAFHNRDARHRERLLAWRVSAWSRTVERITG